MSPDGKIKVVVRSRRVPTRIIDLGETLYTPSGIPMGTRVRHSLLYDYVLDRDHQRTIEEARKLANSLCLDLEVVDSARLGFFGRLLSSFSLRGAGNLTVVASPPTAAADSSPVLTRG